MFHKILVPLDGSQYAEEALQPARSLALAFKAEVRLVTVEEMPDQPMPGEWDLTMGDFLEKHRQKHLSYLNERAEELRGDGLTVTTEILPLGPPPARIAEEARDSKADLIILFSHGRSGLSRIFMGSVAERLTRSAPCPVMLVHHQKNGADQPKPTAS